MLAKAIKADPLLAGTRLVMMTSLDRQEDSAAMEAAGLDAYLTKPVRHAHLFESLSKVIANETRQPARPGLYKHAPTGASTAPNAMRVLIAEDNIVNQKVAVNQVHKLGCHADVVGNGREALDALDAAHYDLVLMDCQMPELDGYKATAQLREREGDARHTRIVAMTAHAIEGDREKCIAAGMDDYLSKPLRFEALREIVKRYQPVRPSAEPAITLENIEALRDLGTEESGDVLPELIDTFLENAPRIVLEARDAFTARAPAVLAQAAHTLMGSCSNFGARPLQEFCAQLESLARSPDFPRSSQDESRARQLLTAIQGELDRVGAALGQYRNTP
jgi:two-component system sensor histidine kinase/response regulator